LLLLLLCCCFCRLLSMLPTEPTVLMIKIKNRKKRLLEDFLLDLMLHPYRAAQRVSPC
jgi:hypothetical protein